MSQVQTRLKAEDWIDAGFRALVSQGPQALKAEPLARALNTTKGSFYWHFKDVPDFHARLLAAWQDQTADAIAQTIAQEDDPVKRLYRIGDSAGSVSRKRAAAKAEPAIRAWAYGDARVAKTVQHVDEKRMTALQDILSDLDLTNPDFAHIIHGAWIGLAARSTGPKDNRNAMSTLMAAILALRDA
ncbi:TetR/AcrR family transcriptional regulator [Aliiroseovarius sediminis]|uniref:TetR/AcrR family transcriptional regulator n=1 Tax=Aliiroseovarius sediminis TaxID=2925839 RepID=UPI001F563902|nr:TetR/AcrR family transcriptional regulator [Aliiroseovarius sediminis]MCI2395840.1 TetR/AcrR family transcriptional regulator [Aliiroseovarius sediminis]